jgi:hypothetical protein
MFFGVLGWSRMLIFKFFNGVWQGFLFTPIFEVIGIVFRRLIWGASVK